MAWISFGALPCREKKNLDNNSRPDVVEIARVTWHASFHPLYQEKTCNSAHEQTPLSKDSIDSVLLHREVGRAKDLSVRLRNKLLSEMQADTHVEPHAKLPSVLLDFNQIWNGWKLFSY